MFKSCSKHFLSQIYCLLQYSIELVSVRNFELEQLLIVEVTDEFLYCFCLWSFSLSWCITSANWIRFRFRLDLRELESFVGFDLSQSRCRVRKTLKHISSKELSLVVKRIWYSCFRRLCCKKRWYFSCTRALLRMNVSDSSRWVLKNRAEDL